MLIQSTYYPFEVFSKRREGISLQQVANGLVYAGRTHGEVSTIDSSKNLNEDKLKVFLTNRSLDQAAEVHIAVADCPCEVWIKHGETTIEIHPLSVTVMKLSPRASNGAVSARKQRSVSKPYAP